MQLKNFVVGFVLMLSSLWSLIVFPVYASSHCAYPYSGATYPYSTPAPSCEPCNRGIPYCDSIDRYWNDIKRDYCNFFSEDNALWFGNYFVAAGILANSGLDKTIRDNWQQEIRSTRSDRFFQPFNVIGGYSYHYVPLYLVCMGFGSWRENSIYANKIYLWGYRSLRTIIVGTIPQLVLAKTLGPGRPIKNQPSKWQPFKYSVGVSGHTFSGAIPFINAAFIVETPVLKGALFVLSTFPGLARINFDAHYTSQVLLGWSLAFLSANAVYNTDMQTNCGYNVGIYPRSDGFMVAASMEF